MSNSTNFTEILIEQVLDGTIPDAIFIEQAYGLFNTTWLGILATVGIALILLSTPQQRRGPVFALQCTAFPMAITNAILVVVIVVLNTQTAFSPENIANTLYSLECAQKALEAFTPLVCDITLIFKVLAFYPSSPIPSLKVGRLNAFFRKRWIPVAPLLVIGIARVCTCTLVTYYYYQYDSQPDNVPSAVIASWGLTYHRCSMAEFVLQIIYCGYASALLFRKIYLFAQYREMKGRRGNSLLQRRLRYLIESLAMTFILPVFAQITAAIAARLGHGQVLYFASLTNVYLSTLLSVLATSWSTIRIHRDHTRDSFLQLSRPSSGGSGGAGLPGLHGTPDGRFEKESSIPLKDYVLGTPGQVQIIEPYQIPTTQRRFGRLTLGFSKPSRNGGLNPFQRGANEGELMDHTANEREVTDENNGGNLNRDTLLASLFDDEEERIGQTTSVEMLSTLPPPQSEADDINAQLPTRGTSGWRRGVLRG